MMVARMVTAGRWQDPVPPVLLRRWELELPAVGKAAEEWV